jgi:hypothetical protein
VRFRQQPRILHVFVLTLGFSRRGFYQTCPNETLPQFLELPRFRGRVRAFGLRRR